MYRAATPRGGFTLVEIMIVVAIIGVLIAIAVPGYINAREQSRVKACQEAQEKLDGATQEWILGNSRPATDIPAWKDLVGASSYLSHTPQCPETLTVIALHAGDKEAECPTQIKSHAR